METSVHSFIYISTTYLLHKLQKTKIKYSRVHCQRPNKLPSSVTDVCFVHSCGTPAWGDNFICRALTTDEGATVGACSLDEHLSQDKWNVSQALVHRCVLPGEAGDAFWRCISVVPALLWLHWEYFVLLPLHITPHISISDPLTINDFIFPFTRKFASFNFLSFSSCRFAHF